jgi:hypothetical protein
MAGANPSDSALFQRMRQQADEAEAETKAQAEREQADADWEALRDPQGRLYYFNAVTRQTAWELPSEVSKAAGLKGKLPPALAPLEKAALATVAAQPAAAASSGGGGGGGGGGAALDDMASATLSQAVATIQQLTKDVSEQHRLREELEEKLAQDGQQGAALKEITDKSVALLKEKKAAEKALEEERARREQAQADLEAARAAGGSDEDRSAMAAKLAAVEAERDALQQTVAKLEKKTNSTGKLAQMWKQIDDDDSGELDARELKKVMVLMGKAESTLDMDAAMAALDEDSSGTVSFGEFQTWWDAQDQTAQNALTTQLKKENEQLKKDVEGAKTRADKIFRERVEALEHRDQLRKQLSKAMGVATETLPHLAVETPESNTAATIQKEEALELIVTIDTEEEAREVCKEVTKRSFFAIYI